MTWSFGPEAFINKFTKHFVPHRGLWIIEAKRIRPDLCLVLSKLTFHHLRTRRPWILEDSMGWVTLSLPCMTTGCACGICVEEVWTTKPIRGGATSGE